MDIKRSDIVALIAGKGDGRPLIHRFMRDLEPSLRVIEDGSCKLADQSMLNTANISSTIARATRETVADLLAVSAKTDVLHPKFGCESDFDAFVTLSMFRNRRAAFDANHGTETLSRMVEPVWDLFGRGFVATVQRSYGTFFADLDSALVTDVIHGPAVCMAYAAAYASVGDEGGYAEVRGLLRLAPWVLPIGSPSGSGGLWLVLVD